jgi:hypothetical protein
MCRTCSWSILRGRVLVLAGILLVGLVVFALAGCGNPIEGGNGPRPRPLHFRVTITNEEVADAHTASLCWWSGSAYVGSRDLLVPPRGSVTFDLGTVKPYGIQVVMGTSRFFAGIIQGPGGYVLSGPELDPTWNPKLFYPYGQYVY